MSLCATSLAEGELAKRVTIRVDSRPACQVFYVGLKGPAYLGQSSQDLEVEPPYLTDASGKPAQYTTGHLVLRAEGHLEVPITVVGEDWKAGKLPRGDGFYRLPASTMGQSVKDTFSDSPWLLLFLPAALLAGYRAWRFRGKAIKQNQEFAQLVQDLDTQGDPLIGRKLGEYKVQARIGQGGMGAVYRVSGPDGGQYAAKVVYFPEDQSLELKRFRREFAVLRQLKHPGLVRAFDYGETSGMAYCVMELLVGNPLSDFVKPGGIPWSETWPLVRGLLEALSFAHSNGIVHRDLKPGNVMVCNGSVKILDFGLARQSQLTAVTITGQGLGTPTYVAPEQLTSTGDEVDPRADIYSLGIMIFELLAGRPPFEAEDIQTLLTKHATQPAPPITTVVPSAPAALDEVLLTMLAKIPANRYSNADQVLQVLQKLEMSMTTDNQTPSVDSTSQASQERQDATVAVRRPKAPS